jgi:HEAT repeat protein
MKMPICLRLTLAVSLLSPVLASNVLAEDTITEASEISVLTSPSTPKEKDAACAWLKRHGDTQSVTALALLLKDEQLSQSARYALESLPGPEAGDALMAALSQTSGLLKAGIIHSLAVRRETRAVPQLASLLTDADALVADVSAQALGEIASPAALKALQDQLDNSSARDSVVDGCLRCARHLLAAGDQGSAFTVYQKIYQRPGKELFHVAAFRGMVAAAGDHGVDYLVGALTNGPAAIQMEAVQMVHDQELSGVTEAVTGLLPAVEPLVEADLIDALDQRDDPAAAPAIATAAASTNAVVRVAALGALGDLGDDQSVPVLVEFAAAAGDPGQAAARRALTLIHRGTPDEALLNLLPGSQAKAQLEIIRAFVGRDTKEAVPQLLALARQSEDPVRQAAFQALSRLVDQPQLAAFAQMAGQMTSDTGRASAAEALGLACRRIQARHGTVNFTPVEEVLQSGTTETRIALLPVCSEVADPKVRQILRAKSADADPQVRIAAINALCATVDPALLPDLVKIAGDPSNDQFREQAIEACVRLTTQDPDVTLPDAEKLKVFQAILPVATTTDEKRHALSGLAALSGTDALPLAEPFLSDPAVFNEAALAVIGICRTLPDADTAQAALEKIPQNTTDQIHRQTQALLKLIAARSAYITAWEFTGPYRQAKKNFTELFDIAFPPETGAAAAGHWRVLPPSDDPDNPGTMDLLKAIGGNQEVAYARTSIKCPAEQPAWLLINSDDGVKVWLNGAVVHANNTSRGLNMVPDKVQIKLKPGWNDLLLKVTQNTQGWGFIVQLASADGSKINGIQYAVRPVRPPM